MSDADVAALATLISFAYTFDQLVAAPSAWTALPVVATGMGVYLCRGTIEAWMHRPRTVQIRAVMAGEAHLTGTLSMNGQFGEGRVRVSGSAGRGRM